MSADRGLQMLRAELARIRTKDADPTQGPDEADWNLAQVVAAKGQVISRFGPVFSPPGIGQLDRETFLAFLRIENNKHWSGLERQGTRMTRDMRRLREALSLLVDEDRPLDDRLDALRPSNGLPMVRGLARAVITPILHIVYPARYGVLNSITEAGMKCAGLWPEPLGESLAEQYCAINPILLKLAQELDIDLWTLDHLWWKLTRFRAATSNARTATAATSMSAGEISHPSAPAFELPSGLKFSTANALERLLRFCREEYDYYDRIADAAPDRIEPLDVLVTVAMNSFVNNATLVRLVHRGLAGRCDALLNRIPVDADLLTFDPELREFQNLIDAAVQARQVLVPVATKVLHRKRRNFIPMLDNVVIGHYLDSSGRSALREQSQQKQHAASVAVEALKGFRDDLQRSGAAIASLRSRLADAGYALTPVRILEILVWTETERQGYYR